MQQENLLACTGDLDGAPNTAREFSSANFMRERITLAAKAASDIGRNHSHMRAGQVQHLAQFTMDIVWRLRRGPEGELTTDRIGGMRLPAGHTGMVFDRRVNVAFVKKPVLTHIVRLSEPSLQVAKLVGHRLVNIADARLVVDLDLWMRQGLINAHQRRQNLILHAYQLERL